MQTSEPPVMPFDAARSLGRFPMRSSLKVTDGICRITLVVRRAEELFENVSLLPAGYVSVSSDVLDFLTDAIETQSPLVKRFELELVVPLAALGSLKPIADEKMLAGELKRYFECRAERISRRLKTHFRNARATFAYGLLFMLGCTLLRTQLAPAEAHSLMSSLREGLLIIGWVALWKPIEELLFNWQPIKEELDTFRALAEMPTTIKIVADIPLA